MNKYEREVALSQLNSERHTLDELKEIYRQAVEEVCERIEISDGKIKTLLSEIDKSDPQMISVLQSQIYQKKFQQSIKNQLDFLLKDLNDRQYASISEYLSNSYDNGFIGTLYSLNMNDIPVNIPINPALVVRAIHIESKLSKSLYEELGEDVELLKRRVSSTISRGIASNMHYSDIARNIANNSKTGLNRAMTITRTEGNRIYNTANLHSGKQAKAKTGADLIKQWDSTLDGVTRPHHRQLDGQVRELDEPFEVGTRKTNAPLQFGIPSEDINCRCIALIKPRWDIDETFTKRDNASGELLEFEGTKDYEDFKKRYWKSVDKSQKSGIMRVRGVTDLEQAKKRDHKIYITDTAIDKVRKINLSDFTDEQITAMQVKHKELLKMAKDKNDSNEILFINDLDFKSEVSILGSEFNVSPGKNPFAVSVIMNAQRQSLVYLHNHPSTNIFSIGDIDTFICEGSIKTMSVVTNQGEVYVLNKTKKYDYNKARMLMKKTYDYFNDYSEIDNNDFVNRFLKKCNEGGIEYAKSK